jgi:hypothetical protein
MPTTGAQVGSEHRDMREHFNFFQIERQPRRPTGAFQEKQMLRPGPLVMQWGPQMNLAETLWLMKPFCSPPTGPGKIAEPFFHEQGGTGAVQANAANGLGGPVARPSRLEVA